MVQVRNRLRHVLAPDQARVRGRRHAAADAAARVRATAARVRAAAAAIPAAPRLTPQSILRCVKDHSGNRPGDPSCVQQQHRHARHARDAACGGWRRVDPPIAGTAASDGTSALVAERVLTASIPSRSSIR
jgi:hypothetical protein